MTILSFGKAAAAVGVSRKVFLELEAAGIIRPIVPGRRNRFFVLEAVREQIRRAAEVETVS